MWAVYGGGGWGIYICPLFSDIGMEFDGKVGKHCSCSFFSHHVGRWLPGFSFCEKQNGPDGEKQRSGLACLCHAKQSLCLPHSCPCNVCFCQSQSHKCGALHQGRQGWQSFWSSLPWGGSVQAVHGLPLTSCWVESGCVSWTWNLPRQFGLAFCMEGGVQFCRDGKHCLPTNGLHLLAGNVEYGVG